MVSESKTINVGDDFLSSAPKKQRSRKSLNGFADRGHIAQLKPMTVKELLLQKLKQYKKEKSRKKKEVNQTGSNLSNETPSLTTSFLQHSKAKKRDKVNVPTMKHNSIPAPQLQHKKNEAPEYGNLKNGLKPTYSQLQKNKSVRSNRIPTTYEIEIEKKFNVGRNKTQKKVGVFIKNHELRRKINDEKVEMKKSNMKTVKNYLKEQNLIKYGTSAPNELLREIYSCSKLCGNVYNINGQSLVHNYMNE